MRKVTKNAIACFLNRQDGKFDNTTVLHKAILKNGRFPAGDNWTVLELFGNEIAAIDSKDNSLYITNAGWKSNTTKERLNALPGVSISQKKGEWYLNGEKWGGEWTKIS